MGAGPVGFLLSLLGLIFDKQKGAAAAGLIISGLLALLAFFTILC